jgi:hypothetical protein
MRYRTIHAVALAALLSTSVAHAGRTPAQAARSAARAAPVAAAPAGWLDLLRALWRGDAADGDHGGRHDPPPHGDPPPEGSGLCPHGQR